MSTGDRIPLHRRCVSVRREPLGEVTDEDAIREGVYQRPSGAWTLDGVLVSFRSPRFAYFDALEALHGHPIPLDTLVWRVELGRLE